MHQLYTFVSEKTIQLLNFAPIWEQLKPLTPLGEQKKRELRPYLPHEKDLWKEEMEHTRVLFSLTEDRPKIAIYIKGMTDIAPILNAWKQGIIPKRIDWFHIVNFLQKGWRVLSSQGWEPMWNLFPENSQVRWRELLNLLKFQESLSSEESFQYEGLFPELFVPLLRELSQIEQDLQKYKIARKEKVEQELHFSLGLKNPYYISRKDEEKIKRLDAHPLLYRVHETPFDIAYDWLLDDMESMLQKKREMCELSLHSAEAQANQRLAERILPYRDCLLQWIDAFGRLDLLYAKACLAKSYHGVMPCWEEEGDTIELEGGIHPTLQRLWAKDGVEFTPVDLSIRRSEVSVIIGPNMGGKSVALKTVGVCTLLAHLGLWVPAQRFCFSPVEQIVFIGGDYEQVETGLSSFGGEMQQVATLFQNDQNKSLLILCDEIGRGTNPEEGEALAVALVSELEKMPWFSCFVSHYGAVAEMPDVRLFQIIGLGDLLDEAQNNQNLPLAERLKYIDHRLQRIDRGEVPKVALTIAHWMGMPGSVIDQAMQWLENKRRGEKRS